MAANELGSTCINGHLITAETQYVYPEGARLAGKMVCKICRANAQKKGKGKPPSDSIQVWNRYKTSCPKGHPYDEENTYVKSDGSRGCKTCMYDSATRSGLKSRYGITVSDKARMLQNQHSRCAICTTEFNPPSSAHVDHDHTTGEVRGLLCGKCNTGLGQFNDSPELLLAAVDYLTKVVLR